MSATTSPGADDERLHALCEAGARSAAAALARFLGEPPSRVTLQALETLSYGALTERLAATDARALSVGFGIAGAVRGVLALVVEEQEAATLLERLVPGVSDRGVAHDRALAAFSEIGNILASAFLNELASSLRTSCIPSVPNLVHDDADAALRRAIGLDSAAIADDASQPAWLVTLELAQGGARSCVRLVVMPAEPR